MRRILRDVFIIGFALFSMFFGAGNVIFPPYLGLESGSQWFLGFACYYLADIGLALLALFAMLRCGSTEGVTGRIGHLPSTLLMSATILCIGPMLAIPRTAASTFELSVLPLLPGASAAVFSALFFLVVMLLCMNESAVVDIVGRLLTPALLIGLLIMIVKGIIDPIGPVPAMPMVENVPATGIEAGYQTMDVLAAMVFGIIILKNAENKGHTNPKSKLQVVAGAGLVAGAALLVVYLGLTYLGVTTSSLFDLSVDRTFLVVSIVEELLGSFGVVLFACVVALACMTTAISLTSASAAYFSKLSNKRLSYKQLIVIICVSSAVISNVGLELIVAIASPILSIVYPPTLVLVALAFFSHRIENDWVFRTAALGALLTSLLETATGLTGVSIPLLNSLPLEALGFGWVLPAIVGGVIGHLIPMKKA